MKPQTISREQLALTDEELQCVRELCRQYLEGVEVWAYGSRVKGTARPSSDLDLVAFAEVSQECQVMALREAFEESNLPFRVDLFIWDQIPKVFKTNICQAVFVIQ